MKKSLLLSAFLFLWAIAYSSNVAPYSSAHEFSTLFLEQTESGIIIYPNPVTEGNLTVKSEESFHSIQILNITGEIVFNQDYPSGTNHEVLEITKLEKGMYLVRIGFPGKANHTAKIIVK
jgi:Secretion system C-terminal sorting domain